MKLNPAAFRKGIQSQKRNMFHIEHGDNLSILRKMNPNQFDSMVTDPPAGIGFMGKDWDKDKGSRDEWIAWLRDIMREAYRVLKPGAYGVVWSLPRTSHWTAMALEDAGFNIRDCVLHIFGQGFPKSHDISKAIDKELGAERETTGHSTGGISTREKSESGWGKNLEFEVKDKPATAAAAKWNGFGTALKPAHEMWWLIQKPIAEATIAKNVLAHGVGGLNIDASRIKTDEVLGRLNQSTSSFNTNNTTPYVDNSRGLGRFPSNLILSHDAECELVGEKKVGSGELKKSGGRPNLNGPSNSMNSFNQAIKNAPDSYGTETVGDWRCTETCAVRLLDEQSGLTKSTKLNTVQEARHAQNSKGAEKSRIRENEGYSDIGGASRFFYTAKPSKSEKNYGLELSPAVPVHRYGAGLGEGKDPNAPAIDKNFHPTVKPIKLMQYLIKLVTPPGGTVLDPFMGSGTTGVAATKNGLKFYGIDQDKQYTELAINRLMSVYRVDLNK